MVHWGLQPLVGLPKNPGTHSQMAVKSDTRHMVLSPHGEGLQGSVFGSSVIKSALYIIYVF